MIGKVKRLRHVLNQHILILHDCFLSIVSSVAQTPSSKVSKSNCNFEVLHGNPCRHHARLKSTLNCPVHVSCLCHIPILETVIEANGIRDIPKDPALYIRLALSGNKLGKTEIELQAGMRRFSCKLLHHDYWQSARQFAQAFAPRTMEPSSVLSLCLKHFQKWLCRSAEIGFIEINANKLLDRCRDGQRELVVFDLALDM